jgi:hypothetical protein
VQSAHTVAYNAQKIAQDVKNFLKVRKNYATCIKFAQGVQKMGVTMRISLRIILLNSQRVILLMSAIFGIRSCSYHKIYANVCASLRASDRHQFSAPVCA